MIVVRLSGGLGNQMFMYAFARQLQKKTKERIYISCREYEHQIPNETKRQYALGCFQLSPNVQALPKWLAEIMEILYKIRYFFLFSTEKNFVINSQATFQKALNYGIYDSEDFFRYYAVQDSKRYIKFVTNYFMSEKYFCTIKKTLLKDFQFIIPARKENMKMIQEISSCNAVCVHIRLGDYTSRKFKYSNYICKEEYFYKAMQLIVTKVENPIFYIFSTSLEDIDFIRSNYTFPYRVRYVDLDNPDYEELRLMIHCRHYILSNSSFSWWAQYLCGNPDKVVVAPSRWINNPRLHAQDIYMENWEIVQV